MRNKIISSLSTLSYSLYQNMEKFEKETLLQFRKKFQLILDKSRSSDEEIVIRGSLKNVEDVTIFLDELRKSTQTEWLVARYISNPVKFIYHKVWMCQRASRNKRPPRNKLKITSYRNAGCLAKLDIKIKKVNRHCKKNDSYLRLDPPLPCVIKLTLSHSHETSTPESLRMLRVDKEVQMRFFAYFDLDMKPPVSKHYHEQQLLKNATPEILADASKNPTMRQIIYMHEIWRKKNLKVRDPSADVAKMVPMNGEKAHLTTGQQRKKYSAKKEPRLCKSVQTSMDNPSVFKNQSDEFCNLLHKELIPDVTLSCDDQTWNVHSSILAAQSEVFAALLRDKPAGNENGAVRIKDLDAPILDSLIEHVYCEKIPDISDKNASSLFKAGHKYALHDLRRACSDWMGGNLSQENCVNFLLAAVEHGDDRLKEAAVSYITEHPAVFSSQTWTNVTKEHSVLAVEVLQRFALSFSY